MMFAQRRDDATMAVRRVSGAFPLSRATDAERFAFADIERVASSRRRANASFSFRAFAPSRDESK